MNIKSCAGNSNCYDFEVESNLLNYHTDNSYYKSGISISHNPNQATSTPLGIIVQIFSSLLYLYYVSILMIFINDWRKMC